MFCRSRTILYGHDNFFGRGHSLLRLQLLIYLLMPAAYCLLLTDVYLHLSISYLLVDMPSVPIQVAADRTSRTFGPRAMSS